MGTITYYPQRECVISVPTKENLVFRFIKVITPVVVLLVSSKYISVFKIAEFIVDVFKLGIDLTYMENIYSMATYIGLRYATVAVVALSVYKAYCDASNKAFESLPLNCSKRVLLTLSYMTMFK